MRKPLVHIVAVDGNSLVHRSFHGARGDAARTADLFFSQLSRLEAEIVRHRGPFSHAVFAFDDASCSQRRSELAEYKSQRSSKDPALTEALQFIPARLASLGLAVVTPNGLEADDVLASLAHAASSVAGAAVLVTSDRDALAHVSDMVAVLNPGAAPVWHSPESVTATYGVSPDLYPLLAALRGDPSDNLAGVRGMGPAKASRLLAKYRTVADIAAAPASELAALLGPVLAARLKDPDTIGVVERNLALMSPRRVDVPLDLCQCRGFYGLTG